MRKNYKGKCSMVLAILAATLLSGCVTAMIEQAVNWRYGDRDKKERIDRLEPDEQNWMRLSYSVTPEDPGVPYGAQHTKDRGNDWRTVGMVDNWAQSASINSGLQTSTGGARWFWHGRHVTWHNTGNGGRGNVASDGWMITGDIYAGTKNGADYSRINCHKTADWREYDSGGRVTSEGVYKGEKYGENQHAVKSYARAVKDGLWKYPDHSKLSIVTETWDMGVKKSSGSEPWPDFSEFVGRYAVTLSGKEKIEIKIEKNGRIVVEKSVNAVQHPVGKEYWLHKSPYFRGEVICPNLNWIGGLAVVKAAGGKVSIERWWPQSYPYEKSMDTIELTKL